MTARLRLYDLRLSRLPPLLGRCSADIAAIAQYVNSAQRRLILAREAGDEGWYGTFAEVIFSGVSRTTPYVTLAREIARIEAINVCNRPVPVNNQFLEYLEFGNGRMPKMYRHDDWCVPNVYSRNNVVTFTDMPVIPSKLAIYTSNPTDATLGLRVFLQGLDQNNSQVYTVDNDNQVQGEFVTLDNPFTTSSYSYNSITGIQKDVTQGQIQIFSIDPNTGTQTLLLTMEPSETVAGYRRYYFHNLPLSCCPPLTSTPQTVQIRAIVKLEPIDVAVDTDYLLLHNLEAIIEECCSVRYSEIDNPQTKAMGQEKHVQAVWLLNGELAHYYGKDSVAVNFAPFGNARMERLHVNMR